MSIDPINKSVSQATVTPAVSTAISKGNLDGEVRVVEGGNESGFQNLPGGQRDEEGSFPGEKKLIELIEKSNKELKSQDLSLKFSIHEKTKAINIKVIRTTVDGKKEVVREFPPEKILDMVASMMEKAGLFVDKRG